MVPGGLRKDALSQGGPDPAPCWVGLLGEVGRAPAGLHSGTPSQQAYTPSHACPGVLCQEPGAERTGTGVAHWSQNISWQMTRMGSCLWIIATGIGHDRVKSPRRCPLLAPPPCSMKSHHSCFLCTPKAFANTNCPCWGSCEPAPSSEGRTLFHSRQHPGEAGCPSVQRGRRAQLEFSRPASPRSPRGLAGPHGNCQGQGAVKTRGVRRATARWSFLLSVCLGPHCADPGPLPSPRMTAPGRQASESSVSRAPTLAPCARSGAPPAPQLAHFFFFPFVGVTPRQILQPFGGSQPQSGVGETVKSAQSDSPTTVPGPGHSCRPLKALVFPWPPHPKRQVKLGGT